MDEEGSGTGLEARNEIKVTLGLLVARAARKIFKDSGVLHLKVPKFSRLRLICGVSVPLSRVNQSASAGWKSK